MELPDVVGFTLGKASQALKEAGFTEQEIILTAPPRLLPDKYDESSRVLRIRKIDYNKVELIAGNIKPGKGPS